MKDSANVEASTKRMQIRNILWLFKKIPTKQLDGWLRMGWLPLGNFADIFYLVEN